MTLTNSRLGFRYRCKIIDPLKGNKSSVYKNNMACKLCTSGKKLNPGASGKMHLHKGYEEKFRLKHKEKQNSTMEENNQSFNRYL